MGMILLPGLMLVGCVAILVLAVLVLVGGIIGFKKAKSKASLIAGTVSAILLTACAWLSIRRPEFGFKSAFLITGLLEGIFIVRLIKTKKFMPSGLMLIFCILEQLILLWIMSVVLPWLTVIRHNLHKG